MSITNLVLKAMLTAPDSQLDATMVEKLRTLIGKPDEEVKTGLHEVLDHCVRYSLASSFVVKVLNYEWVRLGGKASDPAPWREEMEMEG